MSSTLPMRSSSPRAIYAAQCKFPFFILALALIAAYHLIDLDSIYAKRVGYNATRFEDILHLERPEIDLEVNVTLALSPADVSNATTLLEVGPKMENSSTNHSKTWVPKQKQQIQEISVIFWAIFLNLVALMLWLP